MKYAETDFSPTWKLEQETPSCSNLSCCGTKHVLVTTVFGQEGWLLNNVSSRLNFPNTFSSHFRLHTKDFSVRGGVKHYSVLYEQKLIGGVVLSRLKPSLEKGAWLGFPLTKIFWWTLLRRRMYFLGIMLEPRDIWCLLSTLETRWEQYIISEKHKTSSVEDVLSLLMKDVDYLPMARQVFYHLTTRGSA